MTVVVEDTRTAADFQESPQDALARRRLRVLAFAVDVLPAIAVATTMALVSFTVPAHSVWWWLCVSILALVILLMLVNRLLVPVITGWSLGRAFCGIAVLHRDGETPGPWRLLLRDLAAGNPVDPGFLVEARKSETTTLSAYIADAITAALANHLGTEDH